MAIFVICSQGCRLRSNPGLKLANAFGVKLANAFGVKHHGFRNNSPTADLYPSHRDANIAEAIGLN